MGEDAALGARATGSPVRLALALAFPLLLIGTSAEPAGLIGARAASRVGTVGKASAISRSDVAATAVRLEATGQSTKLIFDLTGRVDARDAPLANPDPLVVDLPAPASTAPPHFP